MSERTIGYEELTYRSILCSEYEKRGVGVAITVSALTFASIT